MKENSYLNKKQYEGWYKYGTKTGFEKYDVQQ